MNSDKIILTSNNKLSSIGANFIYVNKKTINQYHQNPNVVALVCSREIARIVQHLNMPNLRLVQLTSSGWDLVDLDYYRSKNIMVCNAAGVYSVAMAEFVIYLMLQSAKRYNKGIKNKSIRLLRGYRYMSELHGKTLGVMGVGSIGEEIAKRAVAFDMKVIGFANKTREKEGFDKIFHKDNVQDFIALCDYIVITLPHTDDTHGFINNSLFNNMKKTVVIINVGRRAVFNEKEFLAFLQKHKTVTAILDMFELLPNLITNPFRRLSNVLVIPGVTAISKESNDKLVDLVKFNISCLEINQGFKNVINYE